MKKIFILFTCLLLGLCKAEAQSDSSLFLMGRILDKQTREPLQGATITLKITMQKTMSNDDGSFKIKIPGVADIVRVSMSDYQTIEMPIDANTREIILELTAAAGNLTGVTVYSTGYNTISPSKSTGAFTVLDNKLLNEQAGSNILDRLKFIASGVSEFPQRVGSLSAGQLIIRGLGSFTSRIQKPLVILDNFEYQGDLDNINPNDVENITILKDAAASAIWGAKAANGVIVITTKKASYNQPLQISLMSNWTFREKPDLHKIKKLSSSQLIEMETFLFNNGFYNGYLNNPDIAPSPVVLLLDKLRSGIITQAEADQQLAAWSKIDNRDEFEKHFYRQGIDRQYALSLQGGTAMHSWTMSGGYDENTDNLNASYRRLTGRLENRIRVTNNMDISIGVNYANSRSKVGNPAYGSINPGSGELPQYTAFADEQGNPLAIGYRHGQQYLDTVGQGLLKSWSYYPLLEPKLTSDRNFLENFQAVIGINYQLTKQLKASVLYRYEKQWINTERLYNKESYLVRDLVNSYSQINYDNGTVKNIIPDGDILNRIETRVRAQNIRGQLDYRLIRGDHTLTGIAGAEISETINSANGGRVYGYDPERLLFSRIDYATQYPLLTGAISTIPSFDFIDKRNNRFVSAYANASYTYLNRYTLTGSMRRDASNLFGVRINDKWKPLWSAGASWDITKESFYNVKWLPGLRIRGSYGHQGNLDPAYVAVTTIQYIAINPYTQSPYSQLQNYPNSSLRWEQTAMINVGVDMIALNGRIRLSADYFKKKLTDLYADSKVDPTAGVGPTKVSNIGEMKVWGWDFRLNTINTQGQIEWSTDLLINLSKDKVVKFRPVYDNPVDMKGDGFLGVEGYSLYSAFSYRWAGLDPANGDPRGYLDGEISKDYQGMRFKGKLSDMVYNGTLIPKVTGSIGNTFSWRNLSLTARVSYKLGYVFRRQSIHYTEWAYSRQGHPDYDKRWKKPGDELHTDIPSSVYPLNTRRDEFFYYSDALIEKGDHVRLEYINLSYELTKKILRRLPLKSLTMTLMASNIGILWRANKQDLDPDYAETVIPRPREISLRLSTNF